MPAGASLQVDLAARSRRFGRVAFALAGAAAVAGCGKTTVAPADAAPEVSIAAPPYGMPMPDPPEPLPPAADAGPKKTGR